MKPIERFTLETHDGPYETWPSRTHARVNGERCGLTVSGYVLLRQFETPDAYLLVTDYDCPFEEAVTFTLVSKDPLKALARRTVGAMYASCHLDDMTWADDRHLRASRPRMYAVGNPPEHAVSFLFRIDQTCKFRRV